MDKKRKILLLTEYFPPEIGAGSSRAFELSRRWSETGADVTVLTGFPDYPDGIISEPYRGRILMKEKMGKIKVIRTFIYPTANKGFFKRVISFFSFTFSSILLGTWATKKRDILIATSPPFSIGLAGYIISRLKRIPFIFEIRDIWPASVVQLGQIENKTFIKILEKIELFLYKKAEKIISVTDSFVKVLTSRGVNRDKIVVIKNGVDLNFFTSVTGSEYLKKELGIEGKEVISYIGTHGLSHALEKVIDTANNLKSNNKLQFMFVGDGAEKESLKQYASRLHLSNVIFIDSVDKNNLLNYYGISDILLVPLKKIPLFKTVLPSKIFEIMAVEKPIITSVDGECKKLIETAKAGLFAEPENVTDLEQKIMYFHQNRKERLQMGKNGRIFVEKYFDRNKLADYYLKIIGSTINKQ
jgi:glycosyltransferase involved in cell wall biosynthesis